MGKSLYLASEQTELLENLISLIGKDKICRACSFPDNQEEYVAFREGNKQIEIRCLVLQVSGPIVRMNYWYTDKNNRYNGFLSSEGEYCPMSNYQTQLDDLLDWFNSPSPDKPKGHSTNERPWSETLQQLVHRITSSRDRVWLNGIIQYSIPFMKTLKREIRQIHPSEANQIKETIEFHKQTSNAAQQRLRQLDNEQLDAEEDEVKT